MKLIYDGIGASGLCAVLFAYFLLHRGKLTHDDRFFNILNICGSASLAVYSVYYRAWFSVILNVVWMFIAVFDIVKNFKR